MTGPQILWDETAGSNPSASANGNAACYFVDRHAVTSHKDKAAFVEHPSLRSLSFAVLSEQTSVFAGMLRHHGIRQDERMAMLVRDQLEFPIAFWGAVKAGVIPIPLNTLLAADIYRHILEDCGASALIVSSELFEVVASVVSEIATLRKIIVIGAEKGKGLLDFEHEMTQADSAETVLVREDQCAFWLYSSGSTGQPKGVRHCHRSLKSTADHYGAAILRIEGADIVFSAAKLFFAYGLGNGMTFPLSVGATAILCPERPTPNSVADLFEAHKPTVFFGVPTLYSALCAEMEAQTIAPFTGLRRCISAGEALPKSVGLDWEAKVGCEILDGVGSTEMLHIFLSNASGEVEYGTSGQPVPGYTVRLVDEGGGDVANGVVGELLVQGASSATDYWNQPEKSAATFENGWTRTGDKFIRRPDGCYEYCGRADDMFKVSGIWVSPFEVEQALTSHPDVLEAAVVARRDDQGLEKPHAFVVLNEEAISPDVSAELKDHVKNSIGKWKYPRWITVVEALPKTATGKIQRFKLKETSAQ